jgi:tripartite-type tricarboxylate transporter receptor subunit TctC
MEDQGAEAVTNSPREYAAYIASETERFGKIVKVLGVKGD